MRATSPLRPCAVETKIESLAMSARECLARIFEAGFSSRDRGFTHTGVASLERRILRLTLYSRDATNGVRCVSLHFLFTHALSCGCQVLYFALPVPATSSAWSVYVRPIYRLEKKSVRLCVSSLTPNVVSRLFSTGIDYAELLTHS